MRIVCVHQTREEHTGEEHPLQLRLQSIWQRRSRQGEFGLPDGILRQPALKGTVHAAKKGTGIRSVRLTSAIRETTVMSGYCERRIGLSQAKAFKGPGGSVVYPRAVLQKPILKLIGILS